ncbi:hypothetical protein [Imhoffiella purpurea]|uniref:Uncharacterized protein n=1 Tax=Imhoffiella purpurea TaxID=1249627 RepID=W9VAK4_9GAMM|nr:hypothetical protein [Imhoffiella purpurea]EXJ13931.1 hypothetical protein D779_3131 [Imhoffiella purpurea]
MLPAIDQPIREALSAAAIALTCLAFLPYLRGILRGRVRPHLFSWFIWGLTTCVVFIAQIAAEGGVGAWPIGVSGLFTLLIAGLAWIRRGDVSIVGADWAFLLAALSSLPLWYATSDPLWAVAVLTGVDLLGFGPTIRKAYRQPRSESIAFFVLMAARNGLVVLALERHSVATVLFPAAIGLACLAVIAILWVRRAIEAQTLHSAEYHEAMNRDRRQERSPR